MDYKNRFKNRLKRFSESVSGFKNRLFARPHEEQVLIAGICSFVLAILLIVLTIHCLSDIARTNGIWTLVTVFVSAPVLFVIWRFRDENVRKDINLKEFQKLAEWVSGAHLVEDKVTTKTQWKEGDDENKKVIEETREFTEPSKDLSIPTYSKRDGAVGLQIAAVYNLLPFFRGEHGESFRKPTLNLLTSAWLAMQQKDLKLLEQEEEEIYQIIESIRTRGKSPLGVAITQVLLSDGGKNFSTFPEVFPNLCLAGMNFQLPGLTEEVLGIFSGKDLSEANLVGADLRNVDLVKARLIEADLRGANLPGVNLSNAQLIGANFSWGYLIQANLIGVDLDAGYLYKANLYGANLLEANLTMVDLRGADLREVDLTRVNLSAANLNEAKFENTKTENTNFYEAYPQELVDKIIATSGGHKTPPKE